MTKIHYKARKIKVVLSFAAIVTSIYIGSIFVPIHCSKTKDLRTLVGPAKTI